MAEQSVVDAFNRAIRTKGASTKAAKALFEAGIVESGLRNLDYGDRDSLGALQQRPSQGWKNATDPYKAALSFLDQAIPLASKYGSAGQLAQAVQRSAFPARYGQVGGQASKYLGGAQTSARPTSTATAGTASVDQTSAYVPGTITQQLAAQLTPKAKPQASPLPTTSFAAKAPLPQGYQGVQTSGAPTPARFDAPQALSALQTLAAVQGDQAASTHSAGETKSTESSHADRSDGTHGSKVLELIHNDGSGPGYGIKNGQTVNGSQVFSDVWAGHQNHVHVAAGPKTVVLLGKLAQKLGLTVSENPHFGGVTQGAHVPDSYHYKGEAIDASGTPKQMDAFAKAVAEYNHTRTL
jgi:hypothetical protein